MFPVNDLEVTVSPRGRPFRPPPLARGSATPFITTAYDEFTRDWVSLSIGRLAQKIVPWSVCHALGFYSISGGFLVALGGVSAWSPPHVSLYDESDDRDYDAMFLLLTGALFVRLHRSPPFPPSVKYRAEEPPQYPADDHRVPGKQEDFTVGTDHPEEQVGVLILSWCKLVGRVSMF